MERRRRPLFPASPPPTPPPKESINDLVSTDARRLTLPVLTIIGLIGTFVWFTWTAAIERGNILAKLETVSDRQRTVIETLRNHSEKDVETWSQQDHEIWCLRAQLANPGWNCPNSKNSQGDWVTRLKELEEAEHPELKAIKPVVPASPATSPHTHPKNK